MGRKLLAVLLSAGAMAPAAAIASDADALFDPSNPFPNPKGMSSGPWITPSLQAAQEYWGGATPCSPVQVWLYDEWDPNAIGRSFNYERWCIVGIDRTWWHSEDRRLNPLEVCILVTHEYGHLLGRGHSLEPTPDDPVNVMNPNPIYYTQPCIRAFPDNEPPVTSAHKSRVPTMTARDARLITRNVATHRAHMARYLLRTNSCRRRSRVRFRCAFSVGGDVGRSYAGAGFVKWIAAGHGGLLYDFRVTRYFTTVHSDGTLSTRVTGHLRWRP